MYGIGYSLTKPNNNKKKEEFKRKMSDRLVSPM